MTDLNQLFELEQAERRLSEKYISLATTYDLAAEKTQDMIEEAKNTQPFAFTAYTQLVKQVEDYYQLAYMARLDSCAHYKKFLKIRKRRERIVHRINRIPRHGAK